MASSFQILSGYVSSFVLHRLERQPQALTYPMTETFDAAVLFVDMVNFTTLSDNDSVRREHEAERLSQLLQTYFSHVIHTIHTYGGDVVRFAGDAVIAIWACDPERPNDPERVMRLATQCGAALHSHVSSVSPDGLRVVIGYGEVKSLHIGGPPGHWQWLLAGDPMVQITHTKAHTKPNEVVVSAQAWNVVADYCIGLEVYAGIHRIIAVTHDLPLTPTVFPSLSRQAQTTLLSYIPTFILDRQLGAQTTWLAEVRTATVLFVHIPNIMYTAPDVVDFMQLAWTTIQQVLATFAGYMVQFIVDDKGTNVIIIFGLSSFVHEDDPRRAVRAAMTINQRMNQHGLQTAIGVKTGRVFCGDCGVPEHWEYAIIGSTINLSARLTQVALDHGTDIVIDSPTFQAIREHIQCEEIGLVRVKGSVDPLTTYRPIQLTKFAPVVSTMLGREHEQELAYSEIEAYVADGAYRCLLIEGEAGIGKSRLLLDLMHYAESCDVRVVSAAADPLDERVPLALWRQLLMRLLSFETITDPNEQHIILSNLLIDLPNASQHVAILNQFFGRSSQDQRASMHGSSNYSDSLLNTLRATITRLISEQVTMLVIDDAHWSDATSWELTHDLTQAMPNLFLLIATRPFDSTPPLDYIYIRQHQQTRLVLLSVLEREDIIEIAKQRLGVESIPDELVTLLDTKAEGNPFFAEELIYTLRDTHGIRNDHNQQTLLSELDMTTLDFPKTIERMIASRITLLDFPTQLVLKVASVIGRSFSVDVLRAVFPLPELRQHIMNYLHACEQHNLIHYEQNALELTFTFRHAITHDIVYNSLLLTQRKDLHGRIGTLLEQKHSRANYDTLYQLATHFRLGDVWDKATMYLMQVGDHAYQVGSLTSARDSYREALTCVQYMSPPNHELLLNILLRIIQVVHHADTDMFVDLQEAAAVLETMHDVSDKSSSIERLEFELYLLVGRNYFNRSDFMQAQRYFEVLLNVQNSTVLGDIVLLAQSFMGQMWIMRGLLAEGKHQLENILPQLKETGRMGDVAISRAYLGFASAMMGDYAEGITICQRTLEQLGIVRSHRTWVVAALLTVFTYWQGCDYHAAIELADELIEQAHVIDETVSLHSAYTLKCWSAIRQDDVVHAQQTVDEYASLQTTVGQVGANNQWLITMQLELALAEGKFASVIEQAQAVFEQNQAAQQHLLMGITQATLARAYAAQQQWQASQTAFEASTAILHSAELMLEYAYVLLQWSQSLAQQHDYQAADELRQQALHIYDEAGIDWVPFG